MHLVPADRAGRRIIDDETVCQAIAGLADDNQVQVWADQFSVLADPTRLALLLCIRAAGPISVSDLGVAVDLKPDTVSQTLRLLRAKGIVAAERTGRVIRYTLADPITADLLRRLPAPGPRAHEV